MPALEIIVPTPDGDCAASLHTPIGAGPWPAVIVYPDAAGVRDTFRVMADRLAALGYVVLLPDVYHRSGGFAPFDAATVFGDPDERQRLMALAGSVTADMTRTDADAFLEFLAGRPEVFGDAVGTTGYCMGGRSSLIVAAHRPDRVAAAASFHGGGLAVADDPDSPVHQVDRITATVLVAGAENDGSFTPEHREHLEKALTAAGVRHTVEIYPAAHGFAVPDNATHDVAADERHWAAMADLFAALPRP